MIRRLFSLWLALGLALACSDASETTAPEGTAATAAANGKKVFHYRRSSAYKTLDPMKQFDQASAELVMNLYDTLLDGRVQPSRVALP